MSEEEQSVAEETEVDATPSTEESGAQESTLDELLAEFDSEPSKAVETKVEEKPSDAVKLSEEQRNEIINDLKSEMEVKSELSAAVTEIKGDLEIEDDYVNWRLEEAARKDERVWKAFVSRHSKPAAWAAVKSQLSKELDATYGKKPTTDKEKIASAVRSATHTTGTSQDVDVKKMSSTDFEMNKEKILRDAMKG